MDRLVDDMGRWGKGWGMKKRGCEVFFSFFFGEGERKTIVGNLNTTQLLLKV